MSKVVKALIEFLLQVEALQTRNRQTEKFRRPVPVRRRRRRHRHLDARRRLGLRRLRPRVSDRQPHPQRLLLILLAVPKVKDCFLKIVSKTSDKLHEKGFVTFACFAF